MCDLEFRNSDFFEGLIFRRYEATDLRYLWGCMHLPRGSCGRMSTRRGICSDASRDRTPGAVFTENFRASEPNWNRLRDAAARRTAHIPARKRNKYWERRLIDITLDRKLINKHGQARSLPVMGSVQRESASSFVQRGDQAALFLFCAEWWPKR